MYYQFYILNLILLKTHVDSAYLSKSRYRAITKELLKATNTHRKKLSKSCRKLHQETCEKLSTPGAFNCPVADTF
jgi:hypothetical protein